MENQREAAAAAGSISEVREKTSILAINTACSPVNISTASNATTLPEASPSTTIIALKGTASRAAAAPTLLAAVGAAWGDAFKKMN